MPRKAVKIINTLFFWHGDKGDAKSKGWGANPCRKVQEVLC